MAITNSDGSIVLSTKIDTSGIEEELGNLKKNWEDVNKKTKNSTKSTEDYAQKSEKSIKRTQKHYESLNNTIKKVGSALGIAFGIRTLFRFSNESGELATQTEASVQRLIDIYGTASDSVGDFIDANAKALGMSKAAAASFASVYGNLFSVWADQATNAELTNKYLQMTAVVASKTGRTVEDVQERFRSGLLGNTEAIEDLGVFVNVKTIEMTDAFKSMANGKSWEQLNEDTRQQIRAMAILEQATKKYGNEVSNTSATVRNKFKAAYEDFKATWGKFVNTVLIPVLEVLTEVFNIATKGMNALMGNTGNILENTQGIEDSSGETTDNLEEQEKKLKDLNKELKKTLAGFDEIQTITLGMTELPPLDELPEIEGTNPDGSALTNEIDSMVAKIMAQVEIGLIAIGLILVITGNIGWGIGFIIAGAAALKVTEAAVSGTEIADEIEAEIAKTKFLVGYTAIIVGVILCLTANWFKGAALIAIGAATVVTTTVKNWESIKDFLDEHFAIALVSSGVVLAFGALLCMAGQWFPGITLIVSGFGALGLTVISELESIEEYIESNATLETITGALLIIIGVFMCYAGRWASGIGAIVKGAIDVFEGTTDVEINENALVDKLNEQAEKIKKNITPLYLVAGVALLYTGHYAQGAILLAKYFQNEFVLSESEASEIEQYYKEMYENKQIGPGYYFENNPHVNKDRWSGYARGTVVPPNNPHLAVLGDNKQEPEIVSPISTMKQAMREIMMEMGGNFSGGNTEVVLEIDGREFGRAVVEQGNRENRRIGAKLVAL